MIDDPNEEFVRHGARLPFAIRVRFIEQLIECRAIQRVTHVAPHGFQGSNMKNPAEAGLK
jgi:hypothetical protein